MNFIRHRLGRRLRRALCVLIAAAMALAPVLSTAAASHEVTHSIQGEHHFHDADHGHAPSDADEMSDAGGLLHGLTHAVHACGHALAILGGATAVPGSAAPILVLPEAGLTPGSAPRTHPFRPPIA
jgi:hypothetical protein